MKLKLLTLFFFFVLVVHPDSTDRTAAIITIFLFIKAQKLIIRTLEAYMRGPRVNYVLSPGQAIADTTAQTFRCFSFAIEFFLIFLYSRLIAYMCQTPAARNIVAVHTVAFLFIHSWEHVLYIYGERAIRHH